MHKDVAETLKFIDSDFLFPSRIKLGEAFKNSNHALETSYRLGRYFKYIPKFQFSNKSRFVVLGLKNYQSLDAGLRSSSHVVLTAKDYRNLNQLGFLLNFNFTFDLKTYYDIYRQLELGENFFYASVKKTIEITDPSFLLIKSTKDPLSRLYAYYARLCGVKVICVQHGVYSKLTPPELLEEDLVDHYIALDESQGRLIERVIPKEKFKYLGTRASRKYDFSYRPNLKILLVGTDIERYSDTGIRLKARMTEIYLSLIRKLQIEFPSCVLLYRCHPSESHMPIELSDLCVVENDLGVLETCDLVCGVSSSFLRETSEMGIATIQLLDEAYPSDRYEDYGYCLSADLESLLEAGIRSFLSNVTEIPYVGTKSLSSIVRSLT